MLRKIFALVISAVIALSPVGASSQEYFFRYKVTSSNLLVEPEEPNEEVVYGVGNDIQAFFVAPVGLAFSKEIPVATNDVVQWLKEDGAVPAGIVLGAASGILSGEPAAAERTEAVYYGYDVGGNRIAKARIFFESFVPVGELQRVSFYGHTGTYFYSELPAPSNAEVTRWEQVSTAVPGMGTRGNAYDGIPQQSGTYGVAWRGFDYGNREVAFAFGDFLVEDGPVIEPIVADQIIDKQKNETFNVVPKVKNSLGTVTYRLVPKTSRPEGIQFASATGVVSGAFTDFDTSASFRIEARDSADGTTGLSNLFTLATKPEAFNISDIKSLTGYVGKSFSQPIRVGNMSENVRWAVTAGQLPEGIVLDELTGTIYGKPVKAEVQEGIKIAVSGTGVTTQESNSFSFTVSSEALKIVATDLHVRTNVPFTTAPLRILEGGSEGVTFSISAATPLPESMTMAADGSISAPQGISVPGTSRFIINAQAGTAKYRLAQYVNVYGETNVAYASGQVKRRERLILTPGIDWDTVRGTPRFEWSGEKPAWIKLDASGAVTVEPGISTPLGVYGPFQVMVTDDFNTQAPSKPFTIEIIDREAVTVELLNTEVERYLSGGYLAGDHLAIARNYRNTVSFELVQGELPPGITLTTVFNRAVLSGATAAPVGSQFDNIVIRAVDEDGVVYAGVSQPFTITVVEPSELSSLNGSLDRTFVWTQNRSFAGFAMPLLVNGYGQITYSLAANPWGLAVEEGLLVGSVPDAGTYEIAYDVEDDTAREPAHGVITLVIQPPIKYTAEPAYEMHRGSFAEIIPLVENGLQPFTYWRDTSVVLPPGLVFNDKTGALTGIPSVEGEWVLKQFVKDKTGDVGSTHLFSVRVLPPLPFDFSYPEQVTLTVGKNALIEPNLQNRLGKVTWELVSGKLPKGMSFGNAVGVNYGKFAGTPSEVGLFENITVRGVDSETASSPVTKSFAIRVVPENELVLEDVEVRHRAGGVASQMTLNAANAVDPLSFSFASGSQTFPESVSLNSTTGLISGQFDEPGDYVVGVQVRDGIGRTATANVTFKVVDRLSATMSISAEVSQFETVSIPLSVANLLGAPSYSLAAESEPLPDGLSIEVSTGAIRGEATSSGVYDGIVVQVIDGFDGTVAKTAALTIIVNQREQLVFQPAGPLTFKQHEDVGFSVVGSASGSVAPVVWTISPPLPEGLVLDQGSGVIRGKTANALSATDYTISISDGKGGSLGQASGVVTISVDARAPLIASAPDSFVFNQYSSASFDISVSNPIGGYTVTADSNLPDGFALDSSTGRVSATPSSTLPGETFGFTATDGVGDVAHVDVVISVADRLPPVVATSGTLGAILDHDFVKTLKAERVLGEVSWEYLSGDLPPGVTFDNISGAFVGTPTSLGTFENIVVRVTDTYNGVATPSQPQTLAIKVIQDGTPISIAASGTTARVGHAFTTEPPIADNVVGDMSWIASGIEGTGLVLDPKTGALSGTVSIVSKIDVTLTVTDVTERTANKVITIDVVPAMELTFAKENDLIYNYTFEKAGLIQPAVSNGYGSLNWSVEGGENLPDGLSFDVLTGAFVGEPNEIGAFGPITLRVSDSLPGIASVGPIWFTVMMNEDPIDLTVTNHVTKVGFPFTTATPVYENILGAHRFYSPDLAGTDLQIDPATGKLSGTLDTAGDRIINVSITDDTLRVTSKPLTIQVLPLMTVTAPSEIRVAAQEVMTPVKVSRSNVVGAATWDPVDANLLPEGMTFNTALGQFEGSPQVLGTFGPITVKSRDSLGDVGTSNQITVISQAGAYFISLAEAELPVATKRIEAYSYDFRPLLTLVGMDVSEVSWTWQPVDANAQLPPGLTLVNGVLSGTPTLSGVYDFTIKASGYGKSSSKQFRLQVDLPVIELAIAGTLPRGELRQPYSVDLKTYLTKLTNIPTSSLTWQVGMAENVSLPPGITQKSNVISGTPTSTATVSGNIIVSFVDGEEKVSSSMPFTLEVVGKDYQFVAIETGGTFSCGLNAKGGVKCWGYNGRGQLGNGTTSNSNVPADVSGLASGVVSISAGGGHACAVKTDGSLYCWGENDNGKLGNGTTTDALVPTLVAGLSAVSKVSAGEHHTCAVTTAGAAKCWGNGGYGRLGNSSTVNSPLPVDVTDLQSSVTDISAGNAHSCAVQNGAAKCWGYNQGYRIGVATGSYSNVPVQVTNLTAGVISVAAGSASSCALTSSGVKCWGNDSYGALGAGTVDMHSATPVDVVGLSTGVKDVKVGQNRGCALLSNGEAKCWGRGSNYQLGTGDATSYSTPRSLFGITDAKALGAGLGFHGCVVVASGGAKCWGAAGSGQLGTGPDWTALYAKTPTDVQ